MTGRPRKPKSKKPVVQSTKILPVTKRQLRRLARLYGRREGRLVSMSEVVRRAVEEKIAREL